SASYDLTLPAIQATSKNITVEYEDDVGYSFLIDQDWLQDDHLDNEKYKPSQYEYKNTFQPYTRNMHFRYDVSTSGDDSEGRAYVRIRHSVLDMLVNFEKRSFGGSLPRSYEENKYMKIPAGILGVQLCAGPADRRSALNAGYDIKGKKIRINEYNSLLERQSTSISNDKNYEFYGELNPGAQGTMGNIANVYAVTSNNGNVYLGRNGTTINVTKYTADSGIQTAEASMYIVKNIGDRELTGPSEYNAMENVHIVWQQKNNAADKWRIYYAVVPFLYEELPDGGFSIMSQPAAPQTTSAPTAGGQKYFIENVLNYPNPFADGTTLTYELAGHSGEVRARIYTITGRLARTLDGLPGAAGYNEYKFDGEDSYGQPLANDVYYLVLLARDERGRWVKARSKIVKLR
ncbi:hypothetical protein NO1_1921, partial [Candidatus Termititenax aidoneus]